MLPQQGPRHYCKTIQHPEDIEEHRYHSSFSIKIYSCLFFCTEGIYDTSDSQENKGYGGDHAHKTVKSLLTKRNGGKYCA